MPGHQPNPLDDVLHNLVQAMTQVDDHLAALSKNVRPFDSRQLSPGEDDLLFHNPALRYQGQMEPTTGMPYTNAQASARLLQELGPVEYVAYVDDYVRRADRRGKEGADANGTLGLAVGPPGGAAEDLSSADADTSGRYS